VQAFPIEKAASRGVPLDRLVNDLLKSGIERFKALGKACASARLHALHSVDS